MNPYPDDCEHCGRPIDWTRPLFGGYQNQFSSYINGRTYWFCCKTCQEDFEKANGH